jgi:hypothetical protein
MKSIQKEADDTTKPPERDSREHKHNSSESWAWRRGGFDAKTTFGLPGQKNEQSAGKKKGNDFQTTQPRGFDAKTTMGRLMTDDSRPSVVLPQCKKNHPTDAVCPETSSQESTGNYPTPRVHTIDAREALGILPNGESFRTIGSSGGTSVEAGARPPSCEVHLPGAFRVQPGVAPRRVLPTDHDSFLRADDSRSELVVLPSLHASARASSDMILPATLVAGAGYGEGGSSAIPTATEIDVANIGPVALRRRAAGFVVFLSFVTLAVIAGIFVSRYNQSNPDYRQVSLEEFVASLGPFGVLDSSSPQALALSWLAKDVQGSTMMSWRMKQRYTLAILYFSLNGQLWLNSTGWLSANHECLWYSDSTLCDSTDRCITFSLKRNEVSGTLPPDIINLTDLERIVLSDNTIAGSISTHIGRLTRLRSFQMENNLLVGPVPTQVGLVSSLENLLLSSNLLVGEIPTEFGLLTNLVSLRFDNNKLAGTIPTQIGLLEGLSVLVLNKNRIAGTVPMEIGQLQNLSDLFLDENELTGTIPTEIGFCRSLEQASFASNNFTGHIPAEL